MNLCALTTNPTDLCGEVQQAPTSTQTRSEVPPSRRARQMQWHEVVSASEVMDPLQLDL